jgi:hypothetical protein
MPERKKERYTSCNPYYNMQAKLFLFSGYDITSPGTTYCISGYDIASSGTTYCISGYDIASPGTTCRISGYDIASPGTTYCISGYDIGSPGTIYYISRYDILHSAHEILHLRVRNNVRAQHTVSYNFVHNPPP